MPDRYPSPRFPLGQLLITPGALEVLQLAGEAPIAFLRRHAHGDWSEMCTEDRQTNAQAIAHEHDAARRTRVFSAYRTCRGDRLWVITEADRSATTILLPSEY